jgi:ABC-type transport system involved in multi-copper enzyme maturation permease subunit
VNRALFVQTLRSQWLKLLLVSLALLVWGALMPIIYGAFGQDFKSLVGSGTLPPQLANFGGGDLFSLGGIIALGFIHPIAIGLNLVFAAAFAVSAVAGERQRGTLEVLLSRPLGRRTVYGTLAISLVLFIGVTEAAFVVGALIGSIVAGVSGELATSNLPILWLNGVLLFSALAAVALAASVSFDRVSPAAGITLTVVIVEYFLYVLGTLWPDAKWLQPYSLFDYVDAKAVLAGLADKSDFLLLGAVTVIAAVFALVVFPKRDLAAPS